MLHSSTKFEGLRKRYIYKKRDWRIDGRTTDILWYEINICFFFLKEKADMIIFAGHVISIKVDKNEYLS